MRLLFILAFCAAIVGCASPQYNYRPKEQAVSFPPLNTQQEAMVGDEMLKQGRYTMAEAIFVADTMSVSMYKATSGFFTKVGQTDKGEFFRPGGRDGGQIVQQFLADPAEALLLKPDQTLCVVTVFTYAACGVTTGFEKKTREELNENTFQQTLIYNGRVGKKINIGYREFSSSIARPAFNNNVEYDLEESREIAYRGARIEVLDATNRSIKYRVLSNFNTR